MAVKFMAVNLEPAFDGTRGWIWVTELDVIDPHVSGISRRFQTASEDFTMPDGTVFVYAFPASEPRLRKAPEVLK
jgi:hypothetical protein